MPISGIGEQGGGLPPDEKKYDPVKEMICYCIGIQLRSVVFERNKLL